MDDKPTVTISQVLLMQMAACIDRRTLPEWAKQELVAALSTNKQIKQEFDGQDRIDARKSEYRPA